MSSSTSYQPVAFTNDGSRIAIQAGQYNNYGTSIVEPRHTQDLLSQLPQAADAPFNSYAKQHEPVCLHNTRVGLLEEIHSWVEGQDEKCIFWLCGLAGTGKSTIARTVARKYYDDQRLAASFFFSRGGGDVSHAGKFVTSIAVQLAFSIPALREHVVDAVAELGDIASQSLRDQWRHLVLGPLSKLRERGPYTIVVDALDECDSDNNVQIILRLLAEGRSLEQVRLRVLLTSRPVGPIRHGFRQITEHKDFVLHNISPPIVDKDIKLYLETELQAVGQKWAPRAGWPGAETIVQLVQSASGLFIWAATACRFIGEGKQFAAKRLATILNNDGNATNAPGKHLDQIYITVLQESVSASYTDEEKEEQCRLLRCVLGSVVVLLSTLSVRALSKLLQPIEEDVGQALADVHAILDIPEDPNQPLRLHHPSFRDFLLDKTRCSDNNFWANEGSMNEQLALCCLKRMSAPDGLRQNICKLSGSGVLKSEIEEKIILESLSPELQYACRYWVDHLQRSQRKIEDGDATHDFLQKHLLHWLEAMSLLNDASLCVRLVAKLQSLVALSNSSIARLLHDIHRFVLRFVTMLAEAPLQIYSSALLFSPENSVVREMFSKEVIQGVRVLSGREAGWDACRSVLEGHSSSVNAVVFSPDGQLVVSASFDKTVRVWDTVTGECRNVLEGHLDLVKAVVVSPDGQLIASGSWDKTVRVWDTATGECRNVLKSHLDKVNAVEFSPDSQLVASGSWDKTVRVWDTATRECRNVLKGHASSVDAVVFSPDGQLVVSASCDETMRVWDTATGQCRNVLKGHSHWVTAVVFSPDGQLVASASRDETVRVWNTATGECHNVLKDHSRSVNAVAFSPDGKLLASASDDKTVQLWEVETGADHNTLVAHSERANAVTFSQDRKLVASASDDTPVQLWESEEGAHYNMLEGHLRSVNAVAFSPDGKLLASASDDKTVRLWEVETRAESQAKMARLASLSDGTLNTSASEHHSQCIRAISFSRDGKLVASASEDETVRVWDAETGAHRNTLSGHSTFTAVAFSPDGKIIAYGSLDRKVRLWDVETGAHRTLSGHLDTVSAIAFSPDGKLIVSSSDDKTVRLWDLERGAHRTLSSRLGGVSAVAFSPDGQLIVSSLFDKTVRLWDVQTGTHSAFEGQYGPFSAVAFSPENNHSDIALSSPGRSPPSVSISPPSRIFLEDQWIVVGQQRLLWLPPQYRKCKMAVHKDKICLGGRDGRLTLLHFQLDNEL